MIRTKRTLAGLGICTLVFMCGCTPKGTNGEDPVLAKINSYELKVSDFKGAVDPVLMKQYASSSSSEDKEQLLDTLISKEVLLQEAQRLNLDKEKSFMKEIEGYWEQALLKSLINREIKRLSEKIVVSDDEILKEYNRLKRRMSAEMFIFADKASAQELSQAGAGFEEVRQALKSKIVSEVPADWYTSEDLPPEIADVLFALKPGEVSSVIEYNNSRIVLRLLNEEERTLEPLEELRGEIKEYLMRLKKQNLLADWSVNLKTKASIKVNREVLEKINF